MKSQKVLYIVGMAAGLLTAGFFNVMHWTTLAWIMAATALFVLVVPSRYLDRSPVIVSISAWIAIGVTTIGVLALTFGAIPNLGWIALLWLILSVMVGWLRPFPLQRK